MCFTKKSIKKVNKQNIRNLENWLFDDVSEILVQVLILNPFAIFFRGYWYLLDEYFMPGEENYEKSLINSQIYGALVLFVFHCGCSLHAGIYGDVSQEKGGNMIEYYYSSYFFMKV